MMGVCMWVRVSVRRQGGPGSVGGCLFIFRSVHGEEVLKFPLEGLEGGPLQGILVPALEHDVVEGRGTVLRTRHAVTVLDLMEDLGVGHSYNLKRTFNFSVGTITCTAWLYLHSIMFNKKSFYQSVCFIAKCN